MAIFKVIILILLIIIYIIGGIILHLMVAIIRKIPRERILSVWTKIFCQLFRMLFKIKVKIEGDESIFKEKGNFIISNHLSYLDGVIIGSLIPLVYVSKSQVMSWPLFGWMTQIGGTIFIDRQKKLWSTRYIEDIANMLKKNINVLLFPEGTSTNGEGMRPFQSIFFEVPFICDSYILPLTIYYTKVDDKEVSLYNRDRVFWYGQQKFIEHIFQVLKLKNIECKVLVHSKVRPTSLESDSFDRKQFGESLRQIILKDYLPIKK